MSLKTETLKRVSAIVFLMAVFQVFNLFAQGSVQWELRDAINKDPLPYLKFEILPSVKVYSSDKAGNVAVPSHALNDWDAVLISGYSINDTIIDRKSLQVSETIFLNTKTYDLPEIIVSSANYKLIQIGSKEDEIYDSKQPIRAYNTKGSFRYTAFIDLPRKRDKDLYKLSFLISDVLKESALVSIRILASTSNEKLKPGKNYPINDFIEVAAAPIVKEVRSPGWFTVDFPEGISVPAQFDSIFVVFDLLDQRDSFFHIPMQKSKSPIEQGFYITPGVLGVFHHNLEHPAIVLDLGVADK